MFNQKRQKHSEPLALGKQGSLIDSERVDLSMQAFLHHLTIKTNGNSTCRPWRSKLVRAWLWSWKAKAALLLFSIADSFISSWEGVASHLQPVCVHQHLLNHGNMMHFWGHNLYCDLNSWIEQFYHFRHFSPENQHTTLQVRGFRFSR